MRRKRGMNTPCARSPTPSTASSCAGSHFATLAPFADEIAVYPALPLPAGADDYALSFCIPMSAPGLKFLCRDSVSASPNRFDHPLSSRFDEQDAFVIFDDVEDAGATACSSTATSPPTTR